VSVILALRLLAPDEIVESEEPDDASPIGTLDSAAFELGERRQQVVAPP
jgi:hypothetical protein